MDPAKGMIKLTIDEFNNLWTGYILILEPYKKLPIYNENNYIISILKDVMYNNKKIIINLFSLTIIVTLFIVCIVVKSTGSWMGLFGVTSQLLHLLLHGPGQVTYMFCASVTSSVKRGYNNNISHTWCGFYPYSF